MRGVSLNAGQVHTFVWEMSAKLRKSTTHWLKRRAGGPKNGCFKTLWGPFTSEVAMEIACALELRQYKNNFDQFHRIPRLKLPPFSRVGLLG